MHAFCLVSHSTEELDEDYDVPPRPEWPLDEDDDYWKKAITFTKEKEDMYVEDDVPIPANMRATKYPFANMGIGQSVFFPAQSTNGKAYKAAMAMGGRRGWKFIARRENDGLRIWRKE
ncbi:MAG: hypothetical protein VCA36_13010 [Opitutales bacterium]